MNYLRRMLSSTKDVSFGRIIALACLLFVMGICVYVVVSMPAPAFPSIDPLWRDIILGLYGITKVGDVASAVSKKGDVDEAQGQGDGT